jgi:hypothetical protein
MLTIDSVSVDYPLLQICIQALEIGNELVFRHHKKVILNFGHYQSQSRDPIKIVNI